jgi:ATP-binding cassette subfamily C protein CydD
VVALATLGTVATIVIAWHISLIVTKVFVEHSDADALISSFLWVASAGAIKALVIWLQELASARSSNAVKVQLRTKLYDSIFKLGSIWLNKNSLAEVNVLATTGLNSLEPYFSKYLPQLVYAALVTPVFVMVIWATDAASGIALIATLPLIPIFMILIGWATQTVQRKQLDSLTKLTQHFLEVLRGLTALRVFGRAKAQVAIIGEVSEQYRVRTMKVLRITFLSGFALELIGSLSVALIAVSIGLRLVNGEISLLTGLFILLLAPEAYLPIRQVGAHFHAATEGVAASQKVLDY